MVNQPELSDGNILVRAVQPTDANVIYEAVRESMNELGPWMPWCHANYSIEDTAVWVMSRAEAWAKGTDYAFAICDAESRAYLGSVGLNKIDYGNRVANLGYWVRSRSTRRGVATSATRLLAAWGFGVLNLQRIEIVASVENLASQRVALKAGALREGIMRRALWLGDRAHDAVLTALVPDDLKGAQFTHPS